MISPPYIRKLITLRQPQGFLFFLGPQVPGGCDVSAGDWTVLAATSASRVAQRLNWVQFMNAEANGARRYSSPFLLPSSALATKNFAHL